MVFEGSITGMKQQLSDLVAEAIRNHPNSLKPIASEILQHDQFMIALIGAALSANQLNRFTALARKKFGFAAPSPSGGGTLSSLLKGGGKKKKPAPKKRKKDEFDASIGTFDASIGTFDASIGTFDGEEESDEEEDGEETESDEGSEDSLSPFANPLIGIGDVLMDGISNYFANRE